MVSFAIVVAVYHLLNSKKPRGKVNLSTINLSPIWKDYTPLLERTHRMNAILHRQGEAQWALIAQILKPCTSRLQLALIDELGSFSQIFESQESIENPVLNQQLKIVRRAYHSGRWQQKVEKIVQILKQYQTKIVPITSGMAIGIDSYAHRGAFEAMHGISIGVLATGIDCIYPRRNALLVEQIIKKDGALITEFFPGTPPLPAHYPQRNRIISGLSLGVLVVEAAINSGSLITAKHALEQNPEVFAIPGSINSPQSRGCHQLIKQGACLVQNTTELIERLAGPLARYGEKYKYLNNAPETQHPSIELSDEETQLLEKIGYQPILIDELDTPWSMDKLLQLLIALKLKGVIVSEQGYFKRI
jgi:DNA protecting protein DprA